MTTERVLRTKPAAGRAPREAPATRRTEAETASAASARSRPSTTRVSKQTRQHRIAKLLEQHAVTSQPQLVDLLRANGMVATQATVSRDLEEMGAIKVRAAGGDSVYAIPELPKEQRAPEEHLRRVLGDWVVEVSHSINLVVLRTPPGSAHVVGSALDRADLPEILGTVAGDDTLLVVAAEKVGGAKVAKQLSALAGL